MSEKNNKVQKVLAILGTVLVLLPILFMLLTGVVGSIMSKQLRCDYMIPAELSLFVLAGSGLLLWAAIRERSFLRAIAWTTGIAFLLLIGCQGVAILTGLASGLVKVDDASAWMAVVIGMLIAYDVGVALLGYWGVRLCLQIFKKSHNTTEEKKQ